MHTQQLTVNQQDFRGPVERGEEASIIAEIAVRFIEHAELTSVHRTKAWIRKVYCLINCDREVFMVFMHLQTGDLTALTRAYEEQARERSLDKQAVQQQMERVIASLLLHFPELAHAVIQLRHITAQIGDKLHETPPANRPTEDFQRISDNRL